MKKKKKVSWIFLIFIIIVFGGLGYYGYTKWQYAKAFKIEITIDEINVREDHTLYSNKVGKVKKGQIYKVLDIYLKDNRYVWYQVKLQNDNYGWIATGRNNRYVKEINNPDSNGDEDYKADYAKPKIIFYENEITFTDLGSINYDHLNITDDSECEKVAAKDFEKEKNKHSETMYCKISHEVYYEEEPKDSDEPQYWIKYIVTDEAGNSATKVQKIIFLDEPEPSKVKDFEDMK